ncbi:MAG: ABC transporter substrate-binding protein [Myxococcota bacterium]
MIALAVGPCSGGSGPELRQPPVVLTVVGPMTGAGAFQGQAMADAARLAVEEANAAGGIDGRAVLLRVADDGNDAARGAEVARGLGADGVTLAVIGHRASDVCIAAGKVYKDVGLPAITASATDPDVTADNPSYFRALFDNDAQGRFLATYARHGLGLEKVGLVNAGRSLVQSFRPAAEAVGVTIAREWSFDPKAADLAALATIAAEAKACVDCQGFVLLASEVPAREAVRALRDAGVDLPILAGQAVGREGFADLFRDLPRERAHPGAYSDNLYAIAVALPDTGGEAMQAFVRAFRERFGRDPDSSAAAYYDAARVVLDAAAKARPDGVDLAADRRRLRDALAQVASPDLAYRGISGPLYFDARRTAVKRIAVGTFIRGVLCSAPTQLELVSDAATVPDAEERLRDGSMVRSGGELFAKVQVVYAGLDVVAIPEVDLHAGLFTADLFIWFRYQGELDVAALELATADAPVDFGAPIWVRKRGDVTTATYRVKTTFRGDFDFHDYPFDTQKLRIELRHRSRTTASLVLALDRLGMRTVDDGPDMRQRLAGALGSSSWKLLDAVAYQDDIRSASTLGEIGMRSADVGLTYSRVNAVMTIGRDVGTYGLRNLLPLMLIIIVLYIGFFLPPEELGTRSTIGITALLTVTVLYQQLTAELPSVSYLVTMDYGFYAACALAMYATLTTVLVFLAARAKRHRLVLGLDWAGRVATPLLLVVMAVVALVRYGS